jgi:hypothetical protein
VTKAPLLAILLATSCCGVAADPIQAVNREVAGIQERIERGEIPFLEITDTVAHEGSPPQARLHYEDSRLLAAFVTAGHESWSKTFSYWFYPDGTPMKYLEAIEDRPDSPPRRAVIYGADGAVLWRNTDEPAVAPSALRELFARLQELRQAFARY